MPGCSSKYMDGTPAFTISLLHLESHVDLPFPSLLQSSNYSYSKGQVPPHPLKFLYGIMIAQVTASPKHSRGTLEVETQLYPT